MSIIYHDGKFMPYEQYLNLTVPRLAMSEIPSANNSQLHNYDGERRLTPQECERRFRKLKKKTEAGRPLLHEFFAQLKLLESLPDSDFEDEEEDDSDDDYDDDDDTDDDDQTSTGSSTTTSSQEISSQKDLLVDDIDISAKRPCLNKSEYPKVISSENRTWVVIGPNGTQVREREFENMQWGTVAMGTRYLLSEVFSEYEMATHTLSGKASPAFRGRERPCKMKLNPFKVADVIYCVKAKTGAKERDIRAIITSKCADSDKLYRKRIKASKIRY